MHVGSVVHDLTDTGQSKQTWSHFDLHIMSDEAVINYYSAPDRGAEYCEDHVCLCVFVCGRISRYTHPIFTKIFVPVIFGRSSVLLTAS